MTPVLFDSVVVSLVPFLLRFRPTNITIISNFCLKEERERERESVGR